MRRPLLALTLSLVLVAAAACDPKNPATPGGSGPLIREIQPSVIVASSQTQMLTVNGQDFSSGIVVLVTRPDGSTFTVPFENLEGATTTSFRIGLVFDLIGTYSIVVRNPGGTASSAFDIPVQTTLSPPRLNSVAPAATIRSSVPLVLLFNGESLASPLTVTMTDPDGFVTMISNDQLGTITSTSFSLTFVPSKRGAWSFVVTTAAGTPSNSIVVSVG